MHLSMFGRMIAKVQHDATPCSISHRIDHSRAIECARHAARGFPFAFTFLRVRPPWRKDGTVEDRRGGSTTSRKNDVERRAQERCAVTGDAGREIPQASLARRPRRERRGGRARMSISGGPAAGCRPLAAAGPVERQPPGRPRMESCLSGSSRRPDALRPGPPPAPRRPDALRPGLSPASRRSRA